MTAMAALRPLDQLLAAAKVGEVRAHEPLAPKVSVRAGGSAELLVRPASIDGLVELLRISREEGAPVSILGGGANTLVGDLGVRGVTVQLPSKLAPETAEPLSPGSAEWLLGFGAGAAIVRLINQMRTHGLVGAEFLAGIPGTLGGAVRMNAGTKHGECMTAVDAIELATAEGAGWVPRASLSWQYRRTQLPAGAIVTRVRFRLRKGDVAASQQAMETDLGYRKRTQPLSQPNFGSVFQNPPGDFAGRLIEQVQLKGHVVGQAQISTLHANWIVNLGGASSRDVTTLMALAQARVHAQTGIHLEPEVQRIGSFAP